MKITKQVLIDELQKRIDYFEPKLKEVDFNTNIGDEIRAIQYDYVLRAYDGLMTWAKEQED